MPVYSYRCQTCDQEFEVTQRMSEPALTACTCGKEGAVTRQLSGGSGLIFKGSGFYITDYKSNTGNGSGESKPAESAPAAAPAAGCGSTNCCMADKKA